MEKKIHLLFSLIMSILMVSIMSFVVTYANIGWNEQTIDKWLFSLAVAWVVAFPLIYFLAPVVKKLVTQCLTK